LIVFVSDATNADRRRCKRREARSDKNKEYRMRIVLMGLAGAAMVIASMSTASAANARYCSTGNIGSFAPTRCDFHTMAQCWATVRGVGGTCIENPDIAWARRYGNQRGRDNGDWR
jgi:hypothetical protein